MSFELDIPLVYKPDGSLWLPKGKPFINPADFYLTITVTPYDPPTSDYGSIMTKRASEFRPVSVLELLALQGDPGETEPPVHT